MNANPNNPALPNLIDNITQNLFQHFANNPQLVNQVLSMIFQRQHQQQQEQQQEQPAAETIENPIEIDCDEPATETADNSNAEEDSVAADFVCVDKEAVDGETVTTTEPATKPAEEGADFDKRLEEAVAQMQQMGFDNDGGWLRQLLISKELDIGRVVDALRPPQPWTMTSDGMWRPVHWRQINMPI